MIDFLCDSLHRFPSIISHGHIFGSVGNVVHTITVAVVSAIK